MPSDRQRCDACGKVVSGSAVVSVYGRWVCGTCEAKGRRPDFDVRMLQQQFKSVQAELARLRKKIDQLEVVKMGKHSAFENDLEEARADVRTEMAKGLAGEIARDELARAKEEVDHLSRVVDGLDKERDRACHLLRQLLALVEESAGMNFFTRVDGARRIVGDFFDNPTEPLRIPGLSKRDELARTLVGGVIANAVTVENELDAVWRRALEEAVIVLQELDAKIGEGAEAEGMSAAVEASARLTLTTAEQLINALRLRGRPRDER